VFDKYFSRVQQVTFLLKWAELLLPHLRRSGIKITKEATVKTFEKKLMNSILTPRSESEINFGCREFAAAHVQGLWQVGEKVAHRSKPFAVPTVWYAPRPL